MSDAAGSSITDLLINQPILVWSLAGGLAILVIAGLLSVFLVLRGRFQVRRAAKEPSAEQRILEAKNKKTAVPDKTTGEAAASKKAGPARPPDAEQNPPASETPIADDQKGFLLVGESTDSLDIDEASPDESTESKQEGSAAEEPKEGNALAALFSADSIVDPYVQALRDHLRVITANDLLTNIRSVSQELQEQINTNHAAKN